MPNKIDEVTSVDSTKREFMVKAGKYAVVGAGMATLMTPGASSAGNYVHYKLKGNNGWGNGDDYAPGNSLDHNNAENGGGSHPKHGPSIKN